MGERSKLQRTDGPAETHRPLLPVLIGFIMGIAVQGFFSPSLRILFFAVALSIIISGLVLFRHPAKTACWLTALLLFLAPGALWFHLRHQYRPPFHVKNLLSQRAGLMRVRARVSASPRPWTPRHPFRQAGRWDRERWIMRVEIVEYDPGNGPWLRSTGGVTVFGSGKPPAAVYGDTVEFMADFQPNAPPTNPGEPALHLHYQRMGSYGTAGGVQTEGVDIIRRSRWYGSPRTAAERLRRCMRNRLLRMEDGGGSEIHPLVHSLLLGDRHALPAELNEDLEDAGAMHFLAISGLHVGIFAAGLWLFLTLTGLETTKKHVALIAFVWAYVLLTGARISSIRAAIMLSMLAGAPLLHRRPDPLSTLAGTAFLILLWRPQELFSTGFHFTFLAVWAIFYLYPALRDMVWPWRGLEENLREPKETSLARNIWMYGSDYFVLSLSIWLVIAPLTALNFNRYSLLLPLLSMALWPLVLFLILNSFLSLLALPLGGIVFRWLNSLSSLLSWGIETLLQFCRALPGFVRYTPAPPLWWVILFYGAIVLVVAAKRKKRKVQIITAGALVLAAGMLLYELQASGPEHFRMTVKDVGHGQSIMLRLPGGGAMLYDAGSTSYGSVRAASGVLWHNRVRRIGALVVSHRHFDHYCFVPELSKQFGIDRLLIPPEGVGEGVAPVVRDQLYKASGEYLRVMDGVTVESGDFEGVFLHPDSRFLSEKSVSRNNRSAVLLCRFNRWRVLLPGDAEDEALERISADHGEGALRADVLLLPHHGALTGELDAFLETVRPRVAVASTGRPLSSGTKKLLHRRGIAVWSTYEDGAVTLDFGPDGLRIEGYLSGRTQVIPGNSSTM